MGFSEINRRRAQFVFELCRARGITEFCICAGARNAPLVQLLEQQPDIRRFHFFEERAATFFAMGRSYATQKPTAILTTSGTAAAECLPALIEAFYQQVPVVAITADRPSRYRGRGSPQTIEQVGLFSHYASAWDCEDEKPSAAWTEWSGLQPFHWNVCFEEPTR